MKQHDNITKGLGTKRRKILHLAEEKSESLYGTSEIFEMGLEWLAFQQWSYSAFPFSVNDPTISQPPRFKSLVTFILPLLCTNPP